MKNIQKYTYYISELFFEIGDRIYSICDTTRNDKETYYTCRIFKTHKDESQYNICTLRKFEVYDFLKQENNGDLTLEQKIKLEEFFGKGFFESTLIPGTIYFAGSLKRGECRKPNSRCPDFIVIPPMFNFRIAVWENEKILSLQITEKYNILTVLGKVWGDKAHFSVTKKLENVDYTFTFSMKDDRLFYTIKKHEVEKSVEETVR